MRQKQEGSHFHHVNELGDEITEGPEGDSVLEGKAVEYVLTQRLHYFAPFHNFARS